MTITKNQLHSLLIPSGTMKNPDWKELIGIIEKKEWEEIKCKVWGYY